MEKMTTLTFPDGSTYEVADAEARRMVRPLVPQVSKNTSDIAENRARLNNLSTLKEGSTTGDAELIDARSDRKGNVYENVGNHIRSIENDVLYSEKVIDGLIAQQTPVKVDSIEECTDHSKAYLLPDGYIYTYAPVEECTNKLPISVNEDGNLFSDTGFIENYRVSSGSDGTTTAGSIKSESGCNLSGYIPMTRLDTLYLSNDIGFKAGVVEYTAVSLYDENFNYLFMYYATETDIYTFNDDGTVSANFSNRSMVANMAYVRVQSNNLSEDSVITVNENISDLDGDGRVWKNTGIEYDPDNYNDNKCKNGLTVAIIGDSISTHPNKNAHEMEVVAEDVGVTLSSFITTYDVGKTISKDGVTSGYTITDADVGTELTFKPCSDDVGKKLGTPKNYNKITGIWWQVASDKLGFEPIVASWSGSSITSHTAGESGKECSYAWHDHTIRKLGKRVAGSMNRIAPDVVLIYRGTNDLSHSKSVRLTKGYFDTVDWNYPSTDKLSDGVTYGYKEGLALTIQKIRETYPNTKIVLCTCNVFKRSSYSHFPTHNGIFSIPQMNNAIREVADFFGCHTIELDKCGITWENCYSEGYITDSSTKPTHPNSKGHALMAQQAISDLVNKLHIADIEPAFDLIEFEVGGGSGDNSGGEVEEKVNFATLGTLVESYYVNKNTGALVASDLYYSYTEIPINGNAVYSAPYSRNVAFYGEDGSRVGGVAMDGAKDALIVPPANAKTMSLCYKYVDLDPTEVIITETLENESGQTRIGDLYGTLTDNHYIDTDDGRLLEYAGEVKYFTYTDIAVEENTTYSAPYARNTAFYDDDGIYLSHISAGGSSTAKITTPAGASFMAITYQHKNFTDPANVTVTLA